MAFDITTTVPDVSYVAGAAQTAFVVPYGFFANGDLAVYDDGVLQTLTTHYTVAGAQVTGGGTVTFLVGRTAGHVIRIKRNTSRSRISKYVTGGALPAASLEEDIDRLLCIMQEMENDVAIGVSSTGSFTISSTSWTGFVAGGEPAITFTYTLFAGIVSIYNVTGTLFGTSNGTTFQSVAGALPAAIRPGSGNRRVGPIQVIDNGNSDIFAVALIAPTGTITFRPLDASGTLLTNGLWTTSAEKGLGSGLVMTYPI